MSARRRPRAGLMLTAVVAAAVMVVGLALTGCTQSQTQVRSTDSADGSPDVSEHVLLVPAEAERVELLAEVEAAAGSVTWTLTDPLGDLRSDQSAVEGEYEGRDAFEPIAGEWRLTLTFDGLSGTYDFRLRARW